MSEGDLKKLKHVRRRKIGDDTAKEIEIEEKVDPKTEKSYQIDWERKRYREADDGGNYGPWTPIKP